MTILLEKMPMYRQSIPQYWIKIFTKHPYCIYFFGPFSSEEAAICANGQYEAQLQAQGKQVVACFCVSPTLSDEPLDSCVMGHNHWLQALMEDYLHMKVVYTREDSPTVLEHHSVQDAYLR